MKKEDFPRKHNPDLIPTARILRQEMTKEEKHLWYDFLKNYPIRFTRQKIITHYIADFYCAKAKLVIELDGAQHNTAEGRAYDEERTEFLKKYGLVVLRIPNNQINDNFEVMCKYIDSIVRKRLIGEKMPLFIR